MKSYKPPSFQERAELSAKVKQAAVDNHLAKMAVKEGKAGSQTNGRTARELARRKKQDERLKERLAEKAAREQRVVELRDLETLFAAPSETEKLLAMSARYTPRRRG